MRIRVGPTIVAIASALALGVAPVHSQPEPRLMLGYYVPYDATSWESLQAHAELVDVVAPQWVSVDGCGNIGASDDQTLKTYVHARNVKIVPSLFTISGWLNHQLLTDDNARANFIAQIVDYTTSENYDGFDLDLEGVDASDRDALSTLTADVATALHAQQKLLTLAIPAKDRDVTTGWAGAYDYAALGASADVLTVMAYEYRGPFSGPGSVAPIDWVERVAAFSASQIPPEKVLLGLAFYGYDWNVTSGDTRSLGYARAATLAEHYQADARFDAHQQSLTFTYSGVVGEPSVPAPRLVQPRNVITTRQLPACEALPPAMTATPSTRKPPSAPGTQEQHEVWLEDSTSAAARLQLTQRYNLAGVAAWRLGLEDPGVWPLLADWRAATDGRP